MAKKLQYANKDYLIKKAVELFPNYTRFGILAFRTFNTTNPLEKQLFALEQRLKQVNPDSRERVYIVAYLLENKKPLQLQEELIKALSKKYPLYLFVDEGSLVTKRL